jgi:uncharacterized protein DUF1353
MSRFITPLRLERIEDTSRDGRGTWRLIDGLVYESDVAGIIVSAPPDFVTDLASVPRLPFAYLLTGGIGHAAAVIHDCLYTGHQVTRRMADAVFHEALLVLGIPGWQAWLMWAGVRIGGAGPWDARGAEQTVKPEAILVGKLEG